MVTEGMECSPLRGTVLKGQIHTYIIAVIFIVYILYSSLLYIIVHICTSLLFIISVETMVHPSQYSRIILSLSSYSCLSTVIPYSSCHSCLESVCVLIKSIIIGNLLDIHHCSHRTNLWRLAPIQSISVHILFGIQSHIPLIYSYP